MKLLLSACLGTLFALATAAVAADEAGLGIPSGDYELDATHGYITFSYSHLGFSNPEVGFNDFSVGLKLDSWAPQNSKLTVAIKAASVDSRVAEFDTHLIGADYFDVAAHPEITFVSEGIEMTGEQTANIADTLTIKGVSKPVVLAATLNKAGMHPLQKRPALGVSARAQIQRSEWGLAKYVPMVSDAVELRIEVELVQSK